MAMNGRKGFISGDEVKNLCPLNRISHNASTNVHPCQDILPSYILGCWRAQKHDEGVVSNEK
jgi:hypothetical protein